MAAPDPTPRRAPPPRGLLAALILTGALLGVWLLVQRPAPAPSPAPAPEAGPAVVRFERTLMGTRFLLVLTGAPPERMALAAEAAFAEADRIERLMSEWRPDSELSRVNAAAGERPVAVSPETFEVVRRALGIAEASDGAFDPTWAGLRGLWRFGEAPRVPDPQAVAEALQRTGWRKVRLDEAARTVFLTEPGMALGLGGIAKGYGIDRAAAVLRTHGIPAFIVDGGGDLYVAGRKGAGRPWVAGVQHPRDRARLLAEVPVVDRAVVTSGDYERWFEAEGRRYHHIIDLRTGYPADRSVAVTLAAPDATLADALATAVFVLGPEAGLALVRRYEGVDAAVLAPDGRVHATAGLQAVFPERWDSAEPSR